MRRAFFLLTVSGLLAGSLAAAPRTVLGAGPGSVVTLEGSSNVTEWRCRGTAIDARMIVAATAEHIHAVIDRVEDGNVGAWLDDPSAGRFPTPEFHLTIPVSTFRCGNRIMESDMRRALKADRHPDVAFRFVGLRGGIEHDIDGHLYRARIAGELTMAGATRPIELTITARRSPRRTFLLHAELPLRMTAFGIAPPTALFGAIRARDELTVRFDLTLEIRP